MTRNLPVVLHVDDEEDIREIAKISLEVVGGLELIQCASGHEALKVAQEGAQPDLFLLDLMMPNLDGVQTLNKLREIPGFELTPAVFMTARASDMDIRFLLKNGGTAVIAKPFDPLVLADKVIALWRDHFVEKQAFEQTKAC